MWKIVLGCSACWVRLGLWFLPNLSGQFLTSNAKIIFFHESVACDSTRDSLFAWRWFSFQSKVGLCLLRSWMGDRFTVSRSKFITPMTTEAKSLSAFFRLGTFAWPYNPRTLTPWVWQKKRSFVSMRICHVMSDLKKDLESCWSWDGSNQPTTTNCRPNKLNRSFVHLCTGIR